MKKLAALVSAFLILAACSAVPAEQLMPAQSAASDVHNAPGPEALDYQVETRLWEDSVRAEDGTMLAWYQFHLPEMSVLQADGTPLETAETPAEQEALEAAKTFNTRFSSWISQEEFESMTQEAAGELELFRENEMEWYGGYGQELEVSLYQTEHLVSIQGTYYSYAGGPHPNRWHMGWCFDLIPVPFWPGKSGGGQCGFPAGGAGGADPAADERAVEYEVEPQSFYWEDYRDILANWSSYAVFFDKRGMVIAFSPYELASYAAGTQSFRFSYDWLLPHLTNMAVRCWSWRVNNQEAPSGRTALFWT